MEEGEEHCPDCRDRERHFDQGKGIFLYDDRMRASLRRFKFWGCREYSRFYGAALYFYGKRELERWRPQMAVPVPLSPGKLRRRGFNQAQDLARELCVRSGLPLETGLVKKSRETRDQKSLDAAHRKRNLQKAFQAARPLSGERILVIDDIYTTGSTIDAVAAALKANGSGPVYFLTLCTAATR